MGTFSAGVVLDSRYELVAPLRDRGIGESWEARDREQDRLMGVKFLRPLAPGAALPRELADHLKALRAFRHDDVLAVVNQGLHEGRPYLVYDRFEGRSIGAALDEARASDAPLDLGLVEAVFDRACLTLHAAHHAARPLLHLALTPGSLLFSGEGGALAVRVVDFGLARHASPDPTAPVRSVRVLSFPAPEQLAAGDALGPATDVFSLGGLLRELLSLPAPLGMTLSPANAARQRDDVPEGLWAVVARALSARPADRYPSVEALRAEVVKAWRSPTRRKPAASEAPAEPPEAAPRAQHPPLPPPVEVPVSGPMPAVAPPMAAFVSSSPGPEFGATVQVGSAGLAAEAPPATAPRATAPDDDDDGLDGRDGFVGTAPMSDGAFGALSSRPAPTTDAQPSADDDDESNMSTTPMNDGAFAALARTVVAVEPRPTPVAEAAPRLPVVAAPATPLAAPPPAPPTRRRLVAALGILFIPVLLGLLVVASAWLR